MTRPHAFIAFVHALILALHYSTVLRQLWLRWIYSIRTSLSFTHVQLLTRIFGLSARVAALVIFIVHINAVVTSCMLLSCVFWYHGPD